MKRTILFAGILAVSAGLASADPLTDRLVADFRAEGFQFIEVQRSATQIKVEAVRGDEKIELVVDRVTGDVLKREIGSADRLEQGRSGVSVRDRGSRTFVEGDDREDDDHDDDHDDDDRDDDDRDEDDDHDDDDRDDDGDDRDDDDRGGDRDDDDHGDDHGDDDRGGDDDRDGGDDGDD